MPYHVGEKGSYGCSGYPAVKDDGEVMGCHNTAEEAAAQIYAINQSEGNIDDKGVGIANPQDWPETKRDGGKFPSSMGQPHPASNGQSVVKDPRKKPKRSRGGVGGDPTGAITAGPVGMSTKSDEEKTDAELFAGFGKDFTRVERRTEVFKDPDPKA